MADSSDVSNHQGATPDGGDSSTIHGTYDESDHRHESSPEATKSRPATINAEPQSPASAASASDDDDDDDIPPSFPLLNTTSPTVPDAPKKSGLLGLISGDDGTDEDPTVPKPFERSDSPPTSNKRHTFDEDDGAGEHRACQMHEFSLYETSTRFLIVGADVMNRRYRILRIDRTADAGTLSIIEDEMVYSKKEMSELLNTVEDGNKSSGGMRFRCSMWGLLGFIRFTGPYYMLLITKRSKVAVIGGHFVYQIDGTELIPLTPAANAKFKTDTRNPEESRFLTILNNLDLSRSFYFSNSYNITRTLQHNISKERQALDHGQSYPQPPDYNSMFVWNNYLLQPASDALKNPYDWCLPVIHGYIDQAALSIYGRSVYIAVIARRSRYFAGARFLKRGANDLGYVANDVETEQIVSDCLTTSFHAPGPKLFANPNWTSYVQHRGSIPLYWTQDNTGVTPKPPIELNLVDPFYSAAALHFDNLFERYGAPVYVLNLIKARERTPRESKLLLEYTNAINYLNQFLPEGKKIFHKAWDMSRASKSRDQDVIGTLERIAEDVLLTTGYFHNGDGKMVTGTVQNGVARTNCIDCLDRTNAAQFVIGKRALGYQLHALGVIEGTIVDYDTDAVNLFTHMFHDHGDTIAVQYGGSQLVNTMETYRKINQWTSHSRDMVESFKRYYNNSFLDSQRQEAYNLFLGNYIFSQGQPMLWDLATDYYLHHADPRSWSGKRRSYINWYTPAYLDQRTVPPPVDTIEYYATKRLQEIDDYWLEFYRPFALVRLEKNFCYNINSTLKYIPFRATQDGRYDLSPFKARTDADQDVPQKRRHRLKKGVTIQEPQEAPNDGASIHSNTTASTKRISLQRWLQPLNERHQSPQSIMKETPGDPLQNTAKAKLTSLDKSRAAQWTFTQLVHESLNPSVSMQETEDYSRYVRHPQNLPLVTSVEMPVDINAEYLDYVNSSWQHGDVFQDAAEEDLEEYADFLTVAENPLTVREEDLTKKRYKAYRKWLRGKSLFKQQPLD